MKKIALISLSCLSALTACNGGGNAIQQPPSLAQSDTIMTVNGKPIKQKEVDFITKGAKQRGNQNIPEEMIIQELVTRELLVQEAEKKQLSKDDEVSMQLYMVNRTVLSQAAQQSYFKDNPVTDEQLKSVYDERYGAAGAVEYKARHILVKTEDEAKKVVTELKAGGDFSALAKQYSTGPSGSKGGDLGWFGAKQMVPPFTAGVEALADGKFTEVAVKTRFGWHVILREGSRTKPAPAFETVKPQIQAKQQREGFQKYIETLKSGAAIVNLKESKEEDIAKPEASNGIAPNPLSKNPSAAVEQVKESAEQIKSTVETAKEVTETAK